MKNEFDASEGVWVISVKWEEKRQQLQARREPATSSVSTSATKGNKWLGDGGLWALLWQGRQSQC